MVKTSIRKLYTKMTDRDRGYVVKSIIVFEKYPYTYEAVILSDEEAKKKGYRIENIVVGYTNWLEIDLWLVVLTFNWKSKK